MACSVRQAACHGLQQAGGGLLLTQHALDDVELVYVAVAWEQRLPVRQLCQDAPAGGGQPVVEVRRQYGGCYS